MLENARDETSLILRRDGRMLAFAKRHLHKTVFDALRVGKKPFGKKGRVQMGDGKARPIKHAFRRPAIERGAKQRATRRSITGRRNAWLIGLAFPSPTVTRHF